MYTFTRIHSHNDVIFIPCNTFEGSSNDAILQITETKTSKSLMASPGQDDG